MLAVHTVIFQKYPLERMLTVLQEAGVQALELSYDLKTEKYGTCVRELVKDCDMRVVGYGGAWNPEDNPFADGGEQRCLAALRKNIAITASLGASYMTVLEDMKPEGMEEDVAWDRVITVYRKAAQIAGDEGIVLVNEFHPGFLAGTPEKAIKLVDDVGSPAFKGCVDLCHVDIMTNGRIEEFILALGKERIGHVHLGDSTGAMYMHMPLGYGAIDIHACLRALEEIGYDGTWSLCLFGYPFPEDGVTKSLCWLSERGIRF